MALTKEQTKYFMSRLTKIAQEKKYAKITQQEEEEPDEVKQARILVSKYSKDLYLKRVARDAKIKAEENRLLDQLHFGEATELLAALKAFEETEFTD